MNLSESIAKALLRLLDSLDLHNEVAKYTHQQSISAEIKFELDPSRADNFVMPISENELNAIINDAQGFN